MTDARRLLWLPAALKHVGLRVNVVGGWESRGSANMHPRVVLLHHTAGSRAGNAPSLRVCIEGRSDLPGPLCHILIGRDGTCHVIASGVAHHAGTGSWLGVTGNSNAIGIEVENVGTTAEPWKPELVETMVRCAAACAGEAGIDPRMVCFHREWAPRRKVDPHTLDPGEIRSRIAAAQQEELTVGQYEDIMAQLKVMHSEQTKQHARVVELLAEVSGRQVPESTQRQTIRNVKRIGHHLEVPDIEG